MRTARARWPICAAAFFVKVTTAIFLSSGAAPGSRAIDASRSEIAVVFPEPALALTAKFRCHSFRKRSRASASIKGDRSLIRLLIVGRDRSEGHSELLFQDRRSDRDR